MSCLLEVFKISNSCSVLDYFMKQQGLEKVTNTFRRRPILTEWEGCVATEVPLN